MASDALTALISEALEVDDLLTARNGAKKTDRAILRASTVALSSHYERYLYALNEEAVEVVNSSGIFGDVLPADLRLYHSKPAVELLRDTIWKGETRAKALSRFVAEEAWLWTNELSGSLEHERLLRFMSAPTPSHVTRYFRYWGFPDIFTAITHKPHVRTRLYTNLLELVDRRNNIAHGDPTVIPTYHDIISYRSVVRTFCSRVDGKMADRLSKLFGISRPW